MFIVQGVHSEALRFLYPRQLLDEPDKPSFVAALHIASPPCARGSSCKSAVQERPQTLHRQRKTSSTLFDSVARRYQLRPCYGGRRQTSKRLRRITAMLQAPCSMALIAHLSLYRQRSIARRLNAPHRAAPWPSSNSGISQPSQRSLSEW